MRRRALRTVVTALLVTGATLTGSIGASKAPTPAQVDQSAKNIFSGHYSQADLAIVRSDPKVAAITPDPTAPLVVKTGSTDPAASTSATTSLAAANYCGASKWVTFYKTSLLGSTIYGWRHVVVYCYTGSVVSAWQDRYDFLSEAQSMIYFREGTSSATGIATWVATSFRQRHLEYCTLKYGCYANTYPYSTIKIYGNNTWWYSGSAG